MKNHQFWMAACPANETPKQANSIGFNAKGIGVWRFWTNPANGTPSPQAGN
jgi:hypothetical protein